MRFTFNFPDIGEGIAEGQIMQWYVDKGQSVKSGDPLVEIETDKVVTDIPCPKSGVIIRTFGETGETIAVDSPLVELEIADDGDGAEPPPRGRVQESVEEEGFGVVGTIEAAGDGAFLPSSDEGRQPAEEVAADSPPPKGLATPVARALAKHLGIEIGRVKGTGPAGRITKRDIQRYAESGGELGRSHSSDRTYISAGPRAGSSAAGVEEAEFIPLTSIRKAIAANMMLSKSKAAHMSVSEEVDAQRLLELYREYRDEFRQRGIKLTLTALIVKACTRALLLHPALNSQYDEENGRIIRYHHVHMGVAVDSERGLLVPVIRNTERKTIGEIAGEIELLAGKARSGKLGTEDLKGGTFTITNYGSIGGIYATPVINYPQAGILGVGRLVETPLVKNGEVVAGTMLPLSLSADHRIVDGGDATRFLMAVRGFLANPMSMFME
jgi:pyruvate dehydrogenase E2 component (dihydrolipoamide acetyltransferase)